MTYRGLIKFSNAAPTELGEKFTGRFAAVQPRIKPVKAWPSRLSLRESRAFTQRRPYLPVRPPQATGLQVNRELYGRKVLSDGRALDQNQKVICLCKMVANRALG